MHWQKPETGRYKCNVDASFSAHRNHVGFGMCIRDDEDRFMLAKSLWSSPMCSVDFVEKNNSIPASEVFRCTEAVKSLKVLRGSEEVRLQ
ncbi:cytochrome P450, partial [Trifolium medium]|nr:cytochrome P450 [Trifolium medium]